jgi:hypothetical protein
MIESPAKEASMMPNVHSIVRDHVSLSVSCIDRLYVNGYVPTLQTSGHLCFFLKDHLGHPIPSPALFTPMHDRFVADIRRFSQQHQVPLLQFERGQRKDDVANQRRARFKDREGVVFIGVAQEKASSFKARKLRGPRGGVYFEFSRQPVAVNHYYFYLQDLRWGPAFLKVGTYLPYPVKLCLNGHEWVKQRLRERRIAFDSLDNGFLSCAKPDLLQEVCDSLGPAEIQAFFDRWSRRLPWPLTAQDRAAGFNHKLSLWQVEVSLTHVFDRPVQGRHFFEEVIRDNLDLGRPDRVSLLFDTRTTSRTRPPDRGYRTRVITDGVDPSLHIEHRRSHIKQYFKLGRALRTETTINDPGDFRSNKAIDNLGYLRNAGATVNRRLLELERVGQNCALTQDALDRLQRPTVENQHRAPALRFGDPRVMALFQALSRFALVASDFRNADLRATVASLLGWSLEQYRPGRMTYDLRRLRLKGLIVRIPGSNRYRITTYGLKVALFVSKIYLRIIRPGWLSLEKQDDIPRPLHSALSAVDAAIGRLCDAANLRPAA